MNLQDLLWLVIAFPLGGAVFLHFFGRRIGEPRVGYLASLATAGSFAIALGASVPFFSEGSHGSHIVLWDWMPAVGASFEFEGWDAACRIALLERSLTRSPPPWRSVRAEAEYSSAPLQGRTIYR